MVYIASMLMPASILSACAALWMLQALLPPLLLWSRQPSSEASTPSSRYPPNSPQSDMTDMTDMADTNDTNDMTDSDMNN